jgi:hypothetical protein
LTEASNLLRKVSPALRQRQELVEECDGGESNRSLDHPPGSTCTRPVFGLKRQDSLGFSTQAKSRRNWRQLPEASSARVPSQLDPDQGGMLAQTPSVKESRERPQTRCIPLNWS